jgi:transcriptional regulator with XRE-family HTH domain
MRNIGDVIKRARMDCGMTQEQLGEKLFVTKQAVSKWETGKAYPDISILEKISKELKIDIADLLTSNLDSTVRKRKTVKLLLIIVPILLVIITSGIIVSYAIKEKQKWIPLVQGSSVYQMPFEELKTEFEYYIYDNFKDFKKSDSAKYHFINAKACRNNGGRNPMFLCFAWTFWFGIPKSN